MISTATRVNINSQKNNSQKIDSQFPPSSSYFINIENREEAIQLLGLGNLNPSQFELVSDKVLCDLASIYKTKALVNDLSHAVSPRCIALIKTNDEYIVSLHELAQKLGPEHMKMPGQQTSNITWISAFISLEALRCLIDLPGIYKIA